MFTQNLHAHSIFDDGKATLEEMLLASKAAGLKSIGFSAHSPLPYSNGWDCPQERIPAYIAQVRRLQEKYAGEIDVFLGVEWDVLSCDMDLSPFDYAIGSVHHLPRKTRLTGMNEKVLMDYPTVDQSADATAGCLADHFGGDTDAMAAAYFAEYDKVAAQPLARIVGHFDLLTKFDEERRFFLPPSPAYTSAALCAMEKLVNAGKIFEVNTGAIARGYRSAPYPSGELLCALHEMGGKVTISADTHHISSVVCAFDLAEKTIRNSGFKEVWRLARVNGEIVFLPQEL